jgi:hypothetical protein
MLINIVFAQYGISAAVQWSRAFVNDPLPHAIDRSSGLLRGLLDAGNSRLCGLGANRI